MKIYVSDRRENIERRGENAGYQHILLFPQSFQKPYFVLPRKTMDCLGNVEAKPVSGTVPMHPPCFLFLSGTDSKNPVQIRVLLKSETCSDVSGIMLLFVR